MPISANWYSVAYGNGMFAAIAGGSNNAAYSDDGINWTQTTMPVSSNWADVAYGNGKFVAVSRNGTIAYSSNGINWTNSSSSFSTQWSSVAYGNGLFVVASATSASNIGAYSQDGINWTQCSIPLGPSTGAYGITFGSDMFVVVGGYHPSFAAYSVSFKPSDAALLALYNRITALENAIA